MNGVIAPSPAQIAATIEELGWGPSDWDDNPILEAEQVDALAEELARALGYRPEQPGGFWVSYTPDGVHHLMHKEDGITVCGYSASTDLGLIGWPYPNPARQCPECLNPKDDDR